MIVILDDELKEKIEREVEDSKNVCCFCGKWFWGFGNNPYPLKDEGVCCDECNQNVVKERIRRLKDE